MGLHVLASTSSSSAPREDLNNRAEHFVWGGGFARQASGAAGGGSRGSVPGIAAGGKSDQQPSPLPPPPLMPAPQDAPLRIACKSCHWPLIQDEYAPKQWKKGLAGKGACCLRCAQVQLDGAKQREKAAIERGKAIRKDLLDLNLTVRCKRCKLDLSAAQFDDITFARAAAFMGKSLQFEQNVYKVDPLTTAQCQMCFQKLKVFLQAKGKTLRP